IATIIIFQHRFISANTVDQPIRTPEELERSPEDIEKDKAVHEISQKIHAYGSNSTTIGLVLSKTRADDLRWLRDYIQEHPQNTPFVYTTDDDPETELLIPQSFRGREVASYLSYVIDYYDSLPPYSIFIHSNQDQWHNDLFGVRTDSVLPALRLQAVDAKGYLNLRCSLFPGCPTHVHPHAPTQIDIDNHDVRSYFTQVYVDILGGSLEDVPQEIGGVCCAQFALSRARIRQRPKSDYVRMLRWVNETSVPLMDSHGVGWVFETLWHVVFGEEACRCDNFGWCGPFPSGKLLTAVTPAISHV
ncbi:hypothetical protein N7468_010641, partial [Penicillium chermesinum]